MRIAIVCSALLLAGCAISDSTSSETLAPLPTDMTSTAKHTVVITPPPMETSTTTPVDEFAKYEYQKFVFSRGIDQRYSQQDTLSWSETWCDFMNRGMGKLNIYNWVMEMASDEAEAYAWLVSAEGSAYFICPQNAYKWNP